jgi:hypothetical protein
MAVSLPAFDFVVGIAMSRLVRTVVHLVHRPVRPPWEFERLATPDERALLLAKTDVRTAA